jgi:alanine racemase
MSDTLQAMKDSKRAQRPCEATIDLAALRQNLGLATRLAGRREVIGVVKADAYGHGVVPVVRALLGAGCPQLAVLTVPEGVVLRDADVQAPILVLAGARNDDEARVAVARSLTPVLHDAEGHARLEAAARAGGTRILVHVEVDTGMHRMGVPVDDAVSFLCAVSASGSLELEGVFTHFARADEPDLAPSLQQLARFRNVITAARARGVSPRLIHADNSAALLSGKRLAESLPEATAVRPGLMLYGVRPAGHLEGDLQPVMTLRASVLALRDVPAGGGVGYAATWRAPSAGARVATLSIGYADGIPWASANRGHVWLAGARRPIVGRISMDCIAVDVSERTDVAGVPDARVALGDEAVVFGALEGGPANPRSISVEEAAAAAGTLHYELLVRVGARVPRVLRG